MAFFELKPIILDYFMSHGEAQTPLKAIRGAGLGGRSGESTLHGDSFTKWTRLGPDGTGDAAGGVEAFPTRFLQGNDFVCRPSGVAGRLSRHDGGRNCRLH